MVQKQVLAVASNNTKEFTRLSHETFFEKCEKTILNLVAKMCTPEITELRLQLKLNLVNIDTNINDYHKEKQEIYDLFKQTIEYGESNSSLLIGPRGAGKTTMVNSIIAMLEENTIFHSNCIFVKLHGLIHTNDRLALKSITSQMNLENVVEGKVFGSFAENLAFLLTSLRLGEKSKSKSIIFILDEFDLFCLHHNQTLLYNLFDVSQSAQTPICVLGISCRLDVIELLEKRVKSRFSHRQYFLFNALNSPLEIRLFNIENMLSIKKTKLITASFVKKWNDSIEKLTDDKKFVNLMQRLLDIEQNDRAFINMLFVIISSLSNEKCTITRGDFEVQMKAYERDKIEQQILDLSVLELCLMISMKHHIEIYDNQPMNFEMIYTRYAKFVNSASNVQTIERAVLMKAFEHLQNIELISNISGMGAKVQKEYQMFKLLVMPKQIVSAVKQYPGLPTEVLQWASNSLL